MKHFVINRDTWYRGMGSKDSRLLLTEEGFCGWRCAMGFCLKYLGVPDEVVADCGGVNDLPDRVRYDLPLDLTMPLEEEEISIEMEIADINDDPGMGDIEREMRLKQLFEQVDLCPVFTNH